jgi:hypothetical protein
MLIFAAPIEGGKMNKVRGERHSGTAGTGDPNVKRSPESQAGNSGRPNTLADLGITKTQSSQWQRLNF